MASKQSVMNCCTNWPAIVHTDFINTPVVNLLKQKQIKIRTTCNVVEGTLVFPRAKMAFLIIELSKSVLDEILLCAANNDEEQGGVIARINKFIRLHGLCCVLVQAPLFTTAEFRAVSKLQSRYLTQKVAFLPTNGAEDCVDAMITMADLQTPPKADLLHQRYCDLLTDFIKPMPQILDPTNL